MNAWLKTSNKVPGYLDKAFEGLINIRGFFSLEAFLSCNDTDMVAVLVERNLDRKRVRELH